MDPEIKRRIKELNEIYDVEVKICNECIVRMLCAEVCDLFSGEFEKQLIEKHPIYNSPEYKGTARGIIKKGMSWKSGPF